MSSSQKTPASGQILNGGYLLCMPAGDNMHFNERVHAGDRMPFNDRAPSGDRKSAVVQLFYSLEEQL